MEKIARGKSSFIKVTEVWVLNRDRTRLELMSGIYGDLKTFEDASKDQTFAYDEGLPGKAWSTGRPVVLKELTDANFKRVEVAQEVGLTCGVAIPVLAGEVVTGIVVFFCSEVGENLGAIEVWQARPEIAFDLTLSDGYYGSLDDFAFISSKTRFRKGFGLPGLVWATKQPTILNNLGSTGVFSRSLHADRAEITTAMGIPCRCTDDEADIVCFLSSGKMPIAVRYEVWVPSANRKTASIHSALCSVRESHLEELDGVEIRKGQGTVGQCWLTGTPRICNELNKDHTLSSISAYELGMRHLVVVPTTIEGMLKSVLAWYF